MELRQLRYFVAVAEELHFGRAARRLGMSQPPLSQQILNLERDLKVQLFRRTKRRVQLTSAGAAFLERVRHIIQSVSQSSEIARRAARGDVGRIEVGYGPVAGITLLPRLVRGFSRLHPKVDVRLHPLPGGQLATALANNTIEVALGQLPLRSKSLVFTPVLKDPLVLACPRSHALAGRRIVALRDLEGVPYVHYSGLQLPSVPDPILRMAARAGVALSGVAVTGDLYHGLALAASGVGVSLLPDSVRHLRRADIVYRRLVPSAPVVRLGILRRAGPPSPVVASFVRVGRRVFPRS